MRRWRLLTQSCSKSRQPARPLKGADLAPGNDATLRALRRRPSRPQEPIASALVHLIPWQFDLDEMLLGEELEVGKACCGEGFPLDLQNHHSHRAPEQGLFGKGSFALEIATRVCREAGARVSMNIFVRDLD